MHWIVCNWQILWITPAYILQSSLYVSVYLCVIHLLQSAAPLRVIFWFLLSKSVKEKQLIRQKWNCCRLQLWMRLGGSLTSLKQHVSNSLRIRFLHSESESSQLTQLKLKPGGCSARSLFCLEKWNTSIGKSFA